METILFIIALVIMFIGFVGTFLPAIPGTGLIFITALLYAIITGFSEITVNTIIILGVLAAISMAMQYTASLITTKKVGASKYGLIGALLGGIIGFIILNVIGLLLGQFIGAILGELFRKTEVKKSLKVGFATFAGYILGVVVESTIAVIMILVFIIRIIF